MDSTDQDLRAGLLEVDEADVQVSNWESHFIESVGFATFPLSEKQKTTAASIIEKYL